MYYEVHVKGPVVQRDAHEITSYLRLVFMLAYVRRDHAHTIDVALCDDLEFPKVKFRFDDVGIVFQTAYALLLPAYTFAKANEINLAELTITVVKLSHTNVRGCLDTAYITGQDGNEFLCRASELRPRSRKQKADPHVANLGLVAAFAGMARAQKKPTPSSSRASHRVHPNWWCKR